MRDEKQDIQLRVMAAKAAAPYMHRALKSVEQSGADGGPQRIIVSWQNPRAVGTDWAHDREDEGAVVQFVPVAA